MVWRKAGRTVTDTVREEIILETVLEHGGCVCDPPGSGEEFCTGHCYLRAEVQRLQEAAQQKSGTEWELRTDLLTGAIRLVCVNGERRGRIYEWQNADSLARMHEFGVVEPQLRAELEAARAEIERLKAEAESGANGE